jgi:hypothetical protein
MLRFSAIGGLLTTKDDEKYILEYYERNSSLGVSVNDPLFWVQYSIARMLRREYSLCENYIAQAYGIVKKRGAFDPFQVETHEARFLLQSRLDGYKVDVFDAFEKARRNLERVVNRHGDDLFYPLEVSHLYLEYFGKFKDRFTERECMAFIEAADFMLDKMKGYSSQALERHSIGARSLKILTELKTSARAYI